MIEMEEDRKQEFTNDVEGKQELEFDLEENGRVCLVLDAMILDKMPASGARCETIRCLWDCSPSVTYPQKEELAFLKPGYNPKVQGDLWKLFARSEEPSNKKRKVES